MSDEIEHRDENQPPEDLLEAAIEKYFISAKDFLALDIPPQQFLVEGLLPDQGILLLTGPPGAGKSWVLYDLYRAILSGTPWMGLSAPTADGAARNAILCNFDNPSSLLSERFKLLTVEHTDRLQIHTHGHYKHKLELPAAAEDLKYIKKHLNARLIGFDSFRQSHLLDEQDSTEMAVVMDCLKDLAWSPPGALVVVVHHVSKGGHWYSRGSGEINASADVQVLVDHDKQGNRTMFWHKHRGWEMENDTYRWRIVNGRPLFDQTPPGADKVDISVGAVMDALRGNELGLLTDRELVEALKSKYNATEVDTAVRVAMGMGLVTRSLGKAFGKVKGVKLTSKGKGKL